MRNMLLALALASASLTVGNIGSAASADLPSQGMQTPSNSMTTGMMESCGRMMSQMMNVAPQQPDQQPQPADSLSERK